MSDTTDNSRSSSIVSKIAMKPLMVVVAVALVSAALQSALPTRADA